MKVAHINPDSLAHNPAFTKAIVVEGTHKTIYVGGHNSVDSTGSIVGANLGEQAERTLINLSHTLQAAGANLTDIVKWTIYMVVGQEVLSGLEAFQKIWPGEAPPPTITVIQVPALSNPEYLVEIDAVAIMGT